MPTKRIVKETLLCHANLKREDPYLVENATFHFNPNGREIVILEIENGKKRVRINDQPGKWYDDIDFDGLLFSSDGRHMVYIAQQGERWCVVLDGVESRFYDEVAIAFAEVESVTYDLAFSPDNTRFIYVAKEDGKWFTVIDGQEGKRYDDVRISTDSIFSPDSRHVAYIVKNENEYAVVFDNQEGEWYDEIRRLIYRVLDDKLVLTYNHRHDGKIRTTFIRDVGLPAPKLLYTSWQEGYEVASPDGLHRACYRRKMQWGREQEYIEIDGKAGIPFDEILHHSLSFTPDGHHVIYAVKKENQSWIIVDETLAYSYDSIQPIPGILAFPYGWWYIFDAPDRLHYIATKGLAVYLVEEILS